MTTMSFGQVGIMLQKMQHATAKESVCACGCVFVSSVCLCEGQHFCIPCVLIGCFGCRPLFE